MKTPRLLSLFSTLAVSAAMLCLMPARLTLAGPKEMAHIDHALELMEQSKKDEHPVHTLEEAREALHKAESKEGERHRAIVMIDEAIAEAKDGHHEKMREKIDHAIDDVRESLHRGH